MARMWRSFPGPGALQTCFSMKQFPWRKTNCPRCEIVPTFNHWGASWGMELWSSQFDCQSFHRSLHLNWFHIKPLPCGHADCLIWPGSEVNNGGFRAHWFCFEITAANDCQGCVESAGSSLVSTNTRLSSPQLTGSSFMHVGRWLGCLSSLSHFVEKAPKKSTHFQMWLWSTGQGLTSGLFLNRY